MDAPDMKYSSHNCTTLGAYIIMIVMPNIISIVTVIISMIGGWECFPGIQTLRLEHCMNHETLQTLAAQVRIPAPLWLPEAANCNKSYAVCGALLAGEGDLAL